jgi:hypothetical protein
MTRTLARREVVKALGNFLGLGIAAGLPAACATKNSSSSQAEGTSQSPTMDDWMERWMGEAKGVSGALHLSRFADRMYFLTRPITWSPDPSHQSRLATVEVPAGFVTDFASIPRMFWSILPPDGAYTYPAIVHDYLYWTQDRTRETADEILYVGMKEFRVSEATATTIYKAVRLGGGSAWNGNARLKRRGEKRVLKEYPDHPTVRWGEWKQVPKHFWP